MKQFIYLALVGCSLVSCKSSTSSNSTSGELSIAPTQRFQTLGLMEFMGLYLKQSRDSAMLLDLRTPPEFDEGYIKGAVLINFLEDDIDTQLGLLDKSKKYFIYCQQGGRSAKCMEKMKKMGFNQVFELQGGYLAYSKADFK